MKLSDTIEHMLKSGMRGRDVVDFVRRWEADQETAKASRRAKSPSDLAEFKAVFADVGADKLEALIKHRRTKGAQLTGLAARLLQQDFEACGLSAADGIDTCISRNWTACKPHWLQPASQRTAPKRESYADAYKDIIGNERTASATDFLPSERLQGVAGHGQENQPRDLLFGGEDVPPYRH